eukprot:g2252.t1
MSRFAGLKREQGFQFDRNDISFAGAPAGAGAAAAGAAGAPDDDMGVGGEQGTTGDVEAKAAAENAAKKAAKKRAIPKLTRAKLLDTNSGIWAIRKELGEKFRSKGRGHEYSDLTQIMDYFRGFAQRAHPHLHLDDFIRHSEQILTKRIPDEDLLLGGETNTKTTGNKIDGVSEAKTAVKMIDPPRPLGLNLRTNYKNPTWTAPEYWWEGGMRKEGEDAGGDGDGLFGEMDTDIREDGTGMGGEDGGFPASKRQRTEGSRDDEQLMEEAAQAEKKAAEDAERAAMRREMERLIAEKKKRQEQQEEAAAAEARKARIEENRRKALEKKQQKMLEEAAGEGAGAGGSPGSAALTAAGGSSAASASVGLSEEMKKKIAENKAKALAMKQQKDGEKKAAEEEAAKKASQAEPVVE